MFRTQYSRDRTPGLNTQTRPIPRKNGQNSWALSTHKGFSLAEIALFIAIVSIAFVTIISIFSNKTEQTSDSLVRDTMTGLAQEGMDIARARKWNNVFSLQNTIEDPVSGYDGYSRKTRVFYTTSNLTDSTSAETRFIRVIVTVYHAESAPISISSLMTPMDGVRL